MAISQPRARLFILADSGGGTSVKSADFEPHLAATGVAIFGRFTGVGTLVVSRIATDGTIAQLSSVAIAANTLSVTTYAYNTGPIRVVFTPTGADTSGYVEAQYFGHAGTGA